MCMHKNCASLRSFITIHNIQIDNAKDLHIIVAINNSYLSLEYSDNYTRISRGFTNMHEMN